jgi:hypothetical protein
MLRPVSFIAAKRLPLTQLQASLASRPFATVSK